MWLGLQATTAGSKRTANKHHTVNEARSTRNDGALQSQVDQRRIQFVDDSGSTGAWVRQPVSPETRGRRRIGSLASRFLRPALCRARDVASIILRINTLSIEVMFKSPISSSLCSIQNIQYCCHDCFLMHPIHAVYVPVNHTITRTQRYLCQALNSISQAPQMQSLIRPPSRTIRLLPPPVPQLLGA